MIVDRTGPLTQQVRQAVADKRSLFIRGGGSKAFYGRPTQGTPIEMTEHRGVVSYAPTELVITARAGTPLVEIEALLAEQGQMLPFEPPHFGGAATFGGMVAAGLSGPRRPWSGAVRDAVLGVKLLNGRGEVLSFGGQVMKNVAGYDLSRLMAGSLGTLALILEASVKVLPRPQSELTLCQEVSAPQAAEKLVAWARQPLPLSASLYHEGRLWLRLCGSAQGVATACEQIGGEFVDSDVWPEVRDQTLPYFQTDLPLWRLSLPAAAPAMDLPGDSLMEWGGALRWLVSDAPAKSIRDRAQAWGGHATLFRGQGDGQDVFHPLPEPLLRLHRAVKRSLDPFGVFNPGRLYPDL